MESDDIYKYLGLFVVIIFVVYVIIKTMNFQLKMVEGFTASSSKDKNSATTDKNKVPDAIKANTDKISDSLLVDKYLRSYEDTIIDLDLNLDMYILQEIVNNAETISADPGSDSNQALMTKLNNLLSFSGTLNHAIQVLDKK